MQYVKFGKLLTKGGGGGVGPAPPPLEDVVGWYEADGEIFADVAGTIPITNGTDIQLIRDSSAAGNDISGTADLPTWFDDPRIDAFPGWLIRNNVGVPLGPLTFACCAAPSSTGNMAMASLADWAATNNYLVANTNATSNSAGIVSRGGGTAQTDLFNGISLPQTGGILMFQIDVTNGEANVYQYAGGVLTPSIDNPQIIVPFTQPLDAFCFLGQCYGAGLIFAGFQGDMYAQVMGNVWWTQTQLEQLGAYWEAKWL